MVVSSSSIIRLRRLFCLDFAVFALLLFSVAIAGEEEGGGTTTDDEENAGNPATTTAEDEVVEEAADDDYVVNYQAIKIYSNLPKPFALFSMICSYVMIREVIADQRKGRGTPITRTLFSMAVADICFSFAWFLGPWTFPEYSTWGGNGTAAFCTFQGFLEVFGKIASVMLNVLLSLFFLLMVRYGWTDRKLNPLEPYLQGFVWLFSLAFAIYPIPLQMYNPDWEMCSIGSHPVDCTGDDCIRGVNAAPHKLFIAVLPWVCLGFSLLFMGMILCSVRRLENQSRKYATSLMTSASSSHNQHKQQLQPQKLKLEKHVDNVPQPFSSSLRSSGATTNRHHLKLTLTAASATAAASQTEAEEEAGGGGGGDEPQTHLHESLARSAAANDSLVSHDDQTAQENSTTGGGGGANNDDGLVVVSHHVVDRRKSRAVAMQALCYTAAFFMTFLFHLIASVWYNTTGNWNYVFDYFTYGVLFVSAGTFNFLVFSRTRVRMKTCEGRFVRALLCCTFCRGGGPNAADGKNATSTDRTTKTMTRTMLRGTRSKTQTIESTSDNKGSIDVVEATENNDDGGCGSQDDEERQQDAGQNHDQGAATNGGDEHNANGGVGCGSTEEEEEDKESQRLEKNLRQYLTNSSSFRGSRRRQEDEEEAPTQHHQREGTSSSSRDFVPPPPPPPNDDELPTVRWTNKSLQAAKNPPEQQQQQQQQEIVVVVNSQENHNSNNLNNGHSAKQRSAGNTQEDADAAAAATLASGSSEERQQRHKANAHAIQSSEEEDGTTGGKVEKPNDKDNSEVCSV